jgi:transcriptional regulator with XRE-family HTH domain
MSPGAPLAVLEAEQPLEDGLGALLARERKARGLSLELVAAATRIRAVHLAAIERDDQAALPGSVYARGYERAYAAYLGLPLPAAVPPTGPGRSLSIGRVAPRLLPRLVMTGPLLGGVGLAVLSGLFALYAWREIDSARQDLGPAPSAGSAAAPPIASPDPLPSAVPTAAPAAAAPGVRPMAVLVRASDQVWLYVEVDGRAVYGANGRFLAAGEEDGYVGATIKITSGKPAATLVSTDGRSYAPLGSLQTKEWRAGQT